MFPTSQLKLVSLEIVRFIASMTQSPFLCSYSFVLEIYQLIHSYRDSENKCSLGQTSSYIVVVCGGLFVFLPKLLVSLVFAFEVPTTKEIFSRAHDTLGDFFCL